MSKRHPELALKPPACRSQQAPWPKRASRKAESSPVPQMVEDRGSIGSLSLLQADRPQLVVKSLWELLVLIADSANTVFWCPTTHRLSYRELLIVEAW